MKFKKTTIIINIIIICFTVTVMMLANTVTIKQTKSITYRYPNQGIEHLQGPYYTFYTAIYTDHENGETFADIIREADGFVLKRIYPNGI